LTVLVGSRCGGGVPPSGIVPIFRSFIRLPTALHVLDIGPSKRLIERDGFSFTVHVDAPACLWLRRCECWPRHTTHSRLTRPQVDTAHDALYRARHRSGGSGDKADAVAEILSRRNYCLLRADLRGGGWPRGWPARGEWALVDRSRCAQVTHLCDSAKDALSKRCARYA
jgi:hypothetical protein